MNLVLASSSLTRIKLLQQLAIPFEHCAPKVDETPLTDENVVDYVSRLSLEKARALCVEYPDNLIIGADQACTLQGLILGKPETREKASKHLKMCSGNWVEFHTGLALLNSGTKKEYVTVEQYRVKFRQLTAEEITAYIDLDEPLDCAGSFKVEAMGITLFEALEGQDYNTLLGLPLIALVSLLKKEGINPLLPAKC